MRPQDSHDSTAPGLLGDTVARDYSRKLSLFNVFAELEIRRAIDALQLGPGMRVLDAGCGSGEVLTELAQAVGSSGIVCGIDLSAARSIAPPGALVIQGDLCRPPIGAASLDAVWSCNTINHLRDPHGGIAALM